MTAALAVRFDITHLKDLDRMKDRFVAIASHELRTPLTAMRGSLGLLQGGVAGELPGEARSLVDIAVQNCERLVRIVERPARPGEDGRGPHGVSHRDPRLELACSRWRSNRAAASSPRYGVRFELQPHESLRVRGDEDRLIQVLSNLLFNAAKFSPRGSVVTVGAEPPRASGGSAPRCATAAPGSRRSSAARVFQRFAQADAERFKRATEGTGLGLAISREIVEQLGGRIGFDARTRRAAPFSGLIYRKRPLR